VKFGSATIAFLTCVVAGCGGGSGAGFTAGGGGSGNVQPLSVNSGPNNDYANGLFTAVTICIPGSSTCQTVNDVLVDTGSVGLRILGSALNVSLPGQTDSTGGKIAECTVFVDGYSWGPVATADVQIAGEVADSLPIQVIIGASDSPSVPAACSNGAGQAVNTLSTLGANGILGIGLFAQDCGSGCAASRGPGIYFACNSSSVCSSTTEGLQDQVQNPVAMFAADNNGVLIQLPAIDANGAGNVSGSLIFGIGTQGNNGLGGAVVLPTSAAGNITTNFNGSVLFSSFVDSGSNALFFHSSTIPPCSSSAAFYCPASTLALSASMGGQNGASVVVPFSVANADSLFSTSNAAFDNLAGGSALSGSFDWGMPFFYGRSVFFAIEGVSTPGGSGPYVAFH